MLVIMSIDDKDRPLADLMDELNDVDDNSADADLNESTISDNNGGRIELDGDEESIKK
jgi:hypothetical protein